MTAASAAPPLASVLYLRMRGWFDEGTARQHERRERLIATAQAAVAGWDPQQRVVLDAPDGLAVVGQVPPAQLLEAAQRAAATADDDRLGIGLHRGAIRAVADPEQQARLQGDGLETASALAGERSAAETLCSFTSVLEPLPPSVTSSWAVESYLTASATWVWMLVTSSVVLSSFWFVA